MLRSDFATRVKGWVEGVKGGVFDRNTARGDFEMGKVDGGDEPWVQQQDVPLSVAARLAKEPPAPPPPAPNEPEPSEEQLNAAREHVAALKRSFTDEFVAP